jgi:DNA-binding XRE family transcriptional regulator
MTTSKFRAIRVQHLADPAFRAAVAREKAVMMQLDMAAVRLATGMTQEEVAAEMGKSQENISRIEHQHDVRVSTLARFVEAQGGELEINAVFAGKRVSLMHPVAPMATPPHSQVR